MYLSIVSAALRPISRFMWMKGSEEEEREVLVTRSGENRNLELGEDVQILQILLDISIVTWSPGAGVTAAAGTRRWRGRWRSRRPAAAACWRTRTCRAASAAAGWSTRAAAAPAAACPAPRHQQPGLRGLIGREI